MTTLAPIRKAVVNSDDPVIINFLPAGYWIDRVEDGKTYLEGADRRGWTLDGYVIPRLASGLFACKEIFDV